ncbi:MAG: DoxX-like family protein [Polyangia bacterium]
MHVAPFDLHTFSAWARLFVGCLWLVFGLVFKLARAVPRHERIVARILGERVAPVLTRLIGVGEGLVGLWMLSGLFLPWCALLQTVLVVTMNAIELTKARDLLLAPLPMVLGNTVLLALAWYAAF